MNREAVLLSSQVRWFRPLPRPVLIPSGEYTLLFDPLSGETCFLGELPALVMEVLDGKPRSPDELVEAMLGEPTIDKQAKDAILTALLYLHSVELADCVDDAGIVPL